MVKKTVAIEGELKEGDEVYSGRILLMKYRVINNIGTGNLDIQRLSFGKDDYESWGALGDRKKTIKALHKHLTALMQVEDW